MTISRSQTGKIMKLKIPPHLQHKVIRSSSPMEKVKKKKPLLPATKKNFTKYKSVKVKPNKHNITAANLWKFIPNVK